jgi:hypothetical protein
MIASEKQISFGKVVAVFLIVGPPTFCPVFYFVSAVATRNADTLLTKLNEALLVVFTIGGLLACYAVGFFPALIAGFMYSFVYSTSRRHKKVVSHRLLRAALIGAVVYSLVCALALVSVYSGRVETGTWPFTVYAAGAGAVSAFLCALIVEIYLGSSSEK